MLFVITDVQSTVFIAPMVTTLSRRGWRVGLITNTHGEALADELGAALSWHRAIPLRRQPHLLWDLLHLLRLVWLMLCLRPQLTHVSTPKAGLLGGVAAWSTRVPVRIYQLRGLRGEGASGIASTVLRRTESIAFTLATCVISNSHSLMAAAIAQGHRVSHVAEVVGHGSSIGVDTVRFHPNGRMSPQRPPVLGYVGRLHADKGLDDMVAVIRGVRKQWPDAVLEVVGGADPTDPSQGVAVQRLCAEPGVRCLGHVDDVARVLRGWEVLVFPSRREGLPNAPLEAQACGVPVVAYAATGTVDAVHDGVGGRLVGVGDIEGLVAAVSDVLGDGESWRGLSEGGRAFVEERFDRNRVVAANVRFIEDQLTGKELVA